MLHYDKLRGKGFPADAFRCDLLSPTDSFPSGTSPAAVLSVTANFVRNGLILTIFLHHTVGDGYSMGKLIDLLAKCTHAKTKSMELPSAELWVQRLEKTLGLNKFGKQSPGMAKSEDVPFALFPKLHGLESHSATKD